MKKRKVFQLNTGLFRVTGIQRVIMDIHEAIKDDFEAKIIGNIPFNRVHPNLEVQKEDYIQFKFLFTISSFRNSVIIIHERILLPFMWILSHLPGMNIKCVYVHHNELYGKKKLSLFPPNVIAISDSGIKNLNEYFNVPKENIYKIYNCVRERNSDKNEKSFNPEKITILYPAGINKVKQQLEIVNYLKGKLDKRVKILFAGTGPLLEELRHICREETQFRVLGFREDVPELMRGADFTMLFSKHEGLPIALIEATMTGTPIICNSVGGNPEIVENKKNGFMVDSWEELLDVLNSLPDIDKNELKRMGMESLHKYKSFGFLKFKSEYLKYIRRLFDGK